ncbi:CoA transferase subunit A [Spirillospora sp. NPDC048911]|uniref:CoA transferase subunit A n=1 Tax=Spirillospora sp. NPDC048911 TaxID=3364527 RepID=UPI0037222BC5
MGKQLLTGAEAVGDIPDGATIAVGGFGICGTPFELIDALLDQGTRDLHIIANNCGVDAQGLGKLLAAGRLRKVTCSYIGLNKEFARQVLAGEIEIDLTPQGTLAERMRAAGAGIAAFYTPTGAGTQVSEGGLPLRYAPDGTVAKVSEPKETRDFGGRRHVLEEALHADFALVRAHEADPAGNLRYRLAARNFNPLVAMAGAVTIAEAEHLVDRLDPDHVHTPGIFVRRLTLAERSGKPIEKITTREA